VLFDLELLPPALVLSLSAAGLALALRSGPPSFGDAAMGLAFGLATTGWPLVALLALGACVARTLRARGSRSKMTVWLIALAGALPPILLVAKHNATAGAPGVIISHNSGINLWLGNNLRWRETWRARPGAAFEPEIERPDREGITTPAARSKYFADLALRDVAERPRAALARTTEKFYYVWYGRELRRNQDIEVLRRASPVLRVLLWEWVVAFPFGVLAPLGLAALWRRRREREALVLGVTALSYAAVLATFFVASRYRLPLVLLLLPYAGDEALRLLGRGRGFLRAAAPALGGVVALNLPNSFTKSLAADAAEVGLLHAQAFRNQSDLERAGELAKALVERFPNDANVRMLTAELLVASGHCDIAISHLERTTALAPRAATPWVMLGSCLDEAGDPGRAERAFATALSLHPFHHAGLKGAALLYLRRGRPLEAIALMRRFEADLHRR
jgi:tetratricopeptide (TPR) repeat protein